MDSSVTSATIAGRVPTSTRTTFPTGVIRSTGPVRVFRADPDGRSIERDTSHGCTMTPTGPSAVSVLHMAWGDWTAMTSVIPSARRAVPRKKFTPAMAATNSEAGDATSSFGSPS